MHYGHKPSRQFQLHKGLINRPVQKSRKNMFFLRVRRNYWISLDILGGYRKNGANIACLNNDV
jgi:hypothetical protein